MAHSPEHNRKKAMARAEALHHYHNSAVDGKHNDMPHAQRMYGDFGYDVEHSALYRAGGKEPNKPLSRHDMNKAKEEIEEGK